MVKRGLLALTFIAALSAVGLGFGSQAKAWSDCNTGVLYPYPPYTVGYAPYVAPRVAYYPPVPLRTYPVYYGRAYDRHHHHDHHHNGVTISFGF